MRRLRLIWRGACRAGGGQPFSGLVRYAGPSIRSTTGSPQPSFRAASAFVVCYPSMVTVLSAGQKAARTKKRRAAARKMWQTRRRKSAWAKAHAAEAASKVALETYCKENGWKIAFFASATGAPRTGIIDAVAFRLGRKNSDFLDIRLVQLKGGSAGVTAREIARLKNAALNARVSWLIAEFHGQIPHLLPDDPVADKHSVVFL